MRGHKIKYIKVQSWRFSWLIPAPSRTYIIKLLPLRLNGLGSVYDLGVFKLRLLILNEEWN